MSTLNVNTINSASGSGQPAISGLAKAWVNFNGTGTVAIRASYNVSSITDVAVGLYLVNMTTAMPDTNYCNIATGGGGSGLFFVRDNADGVAKTTTQFRLNFATISGPADADHPQCNVAVFR